VFSANALEPVPPTTKFVSFDTVSSALALLRAGKVQVLLGQKYFGWGGESIKLLHGIINGQRPANPIIDSGVDVVTAANVDAYEAAWKLIEGR
jgi:ribose transport system substrate-binding protein